MRASDLDEVLIDHASVRAEVPLGPMMHLRIGGAAEWFVEPFDEQGVCATVRACQQRGLPLRILGGGSNVVVADAGVRGVVMHLGNLSRLQREGRRVTVGAGVTMPSLLRSTREAGLAGLEKLTGIPAEVGGAVAMNAGTRDGETFEHLVSLTVVEPDGRLRILGAGDFQPRYRNGGLGDSVVVQATFELEEDRPDAIFERFSASLQKRNASQPVTQRSVGCVFQNPAGDAAGRLIQEAGCKALRRNGVEVSDKHANYFVNDDTGTAADFLLLMEDVQARVESAFGVALRPEVKFWGFEDR
ncbi:MAG: UDP-N-acetylmuramate dehydrogenase [Planctomycetota bacterium]|nr:UDP-N-acetylmuramate dehydrogenase [Planctomycetota bacterium]MEC9046535.1 UDP-N-acetylmuramate dehydrogenase [Planctomycetota bacterium]